MNIYDKAEQSELDERFRAYWTKKYEAAKAAGDWVSCSKAVEALRRGRVSIAIGYY